MTAETAVAWKSKFFILDDVSMETAAAMIEERYNAKIIFSDSKLKQCRVHAAFLNDESFETIMNIISSALNATYALQPDGNVKLEGEGCE